MNSPENTKFHWYLNLEITNKIQTILIKVENNNIIDESDFSFEKFHCGTRFEIHFKFKKGSRFYSDAELGSEDIFSEVSAELSKTN